MRDDLKVGVFLCECGGNIADVIDSKSTNSKIPFNIEIKIPDCLLYGSSNPYLTISGKAGCLPVSMSTNIVFPAPFLPMMAICSPSSIQKFTGSAIDHSGLRALALISSIVFTD